LDWIEAVRATNLSRPAPGQRIKKDRAKAERGSKETLIAISLMWSSPAFLKPIEACANNSTNKNAALIIHMEPATCAESK
jgi:hypothetical protein